MPDIQTAVKSGGAIWKTISQAPLIITGILIGMAIAPLVCGTHTTQLSHTSDTVMVAGKKDTLYHDRWHRIKSENIHGLTSDSAACPEFSLFSYPLSSSDTITLIGIHCQTQTIDYAWIDSYQPEQSIAETDTVKISDTIIVKQEPNVPEIGYDVSPYVSTEAFGIMAEGIFFQKYHLFAGPRIEYLKPGSVFSKFSIEVGFSFSLSSSN